MFDHRGKVKDRRGVRQEIRGVSDGSQEEEDKRKKEEMKGGATV